MNAEACRTRTNHGADIPMPIDTRNTCNKHANCREAEVLWQRDHMLSLHYPWHFHCFAEGECNCFEATVV